MNQKERRGDKKPLPHTVHCELQHYCETVSTSLACSISRVNIKKEKKEGKRGGLPQIAQRMSPY